ncbi:PHP domain-containing protein [Patescibacteria group bacterium]|nr:PHP domain-containing protein [Patescibacteria group bacterium]
MKIDLQLHSSYSDGYLTPTELVKFIAKNGVKVASLTDHNTVRGQEEFKHACRKHKIKYIVGLELYVKLGTKKLNMLWFNFNASDPELHQILRATQLRRRAKVRKHLELLVEKYKLKIDVNKVLDKYNHYVSINHIIDDIWDVPKNKPIIKRLLENKYPREGEIIKGLFYNKLFGSIMHQSYINIDRIIKLRKKIGGQLILNHPGKNHDLKLDLLEKLKKIGLDGIEVLTPHHSIGSTMYAQFLAKKLNLIMTGGSDFHRFEGDGFLIQSSMDYFSIDCRQLRGIDKIIAISGKECPTDN